MYRYIRIQFLHLEISTADVVSRTNGKQTFVDFLTEKWRQRSRFPPSRILAVQSQTLVASIKLQLIQDP